MRARLALALLCAVPVAAAAQDSVQVRHLLALDISRLAPFQRSYDMVLYQRDSAIVIGSRDVALVATEYAGRPAWLLVEHRTGAVPAAESLFVAMDARPVHWSSWLGPARLAAEFVGDTILGATTLGSAKQNLVMQGRPDLLVSGAMVELLLGLLPLEDQWRDSAAVLSITTSGRAVIPVELMMLGREEIGSDPAMMRPANVVALRSEQRSVLYWVDVETGAVLRMQQLVPAHVGSLLEYRARPATPPPAP